MEKKYYVLSREPRGDLYFRLVDFAHEQGVLALLVVRSANGLSEEGQALMDALQEFLYRHERSNVWPGTELLGEKADVFYYHLTSGCAALLKSATHRLYRWRQPMLPEDLCFLRGDEEPWFVSISHERFADFVLSESEFLALARNVPTIEKHLRVLEDTEGEPE